MIVKNHSFHQVTWWLSPPRLQDRRLDVANSKPSQASAVGSSPGPDQPFFFPFFCNFFLPFTMKKDRKNVSKRFCVYSSILVNDRIPNIRPNIRQKTAEYSVPNIRQRWPIGRYLKNAENLRFFATFPVIFNIFPLKICLAFLLLFYRKVAIRKYILYHILLYKLLPNLTL